MIYGRRTKVIASILLIILFHEIIIPLWLPLQATIQPEAFGSSGSSQYVDPFTGQFNYSIPAITVPGPNGSDYTLDLTYNSGIKPEEEASWVGWGWNLSPGSIARMKNGLPDDIKSTQITEFNKTEPTEVTSTGLSLNTEIYDTKPINSADVTATHHSITGWTLSAGLGAKILFIPLGLSVNNESIGFRVSEGLGNIVSSSLSLNIPFNNNKINNRNTIEFDEQSHTHTYDFDIHLTTLFPLVGVSPTAHKTSVLQKTKEISTYLGSGFLFSGEQRLYDVGNEKRGEKMDYTIDKECPHYSGNKGHKNVSLPRSGEDIFYVSGKGPTGQFKAFHNKPITFSPRTSVSKLKRTKEHHEVITGTSFGYGFGFGLSGSDGIFNDKYIGSLIYQGYVVPPSDIKGCDMDELKRNYPMAGFEKPGYCQSKEYAKNQGRYVFRFLNDPGQPLHYGSSHNFNQQSNNGKSIYEPYPIVNGTNTMNSGIMINHRTKEDLNTVQKRRELSYSANYTKFSGDHVGTDKSESALSSSKGQNNSIQEFTVFDNQGKKYIYGLPLYSRRDHVLNFMYDRSHNTQSNRIIYENKSIYENSSSSTLKENLPNVVGHKVDAEYAHAYMPTQILSSDYQDIDQDGPDTDDLGTYVLLQYKNKGYQKWRTPYRGFYYEPARKKEGLYNSASVMYGEKEISYLTTIYTKTHVAYFITNKTNRSITTPTGNLLLAGSGKERLDAYPAISDEAIAGTNTPLNLTNNPKEVLERIEIYSINSDKIPIEKLKTVYFSYSYELMQHTPDNFSNQGNQSTGKLTLKSVWSEDVNIKEAYVQKYIFDYTYPVAPMNTDNAYQPFFASLPNTVSQQNPDYSPERIDAWGYYQPDNNKYRKHMYWNNQNPISGFDPAAWHLKKITTPTGSEIHVHYEQQDYLYVQNHRAMSMQPVLQQSEDEQGEDIYSYRIKVTDNPSERASIIEELRQRFIDNKERIYFRFTYKTLENSTFGTRIMQGFTRVNNIVPYSSNSTDILINIDNNGAADFAPQNVANDFLRKYGTVSTPLNTFIPHLDWIIAVMATANSALYSLISLSPDIVIDDEDNNPVSFFRIPILKSKKGGGVRVKRVLTVSPYNSLESNVSNKPTIYGEEYTYTTFDSQTKKHLSSGVALNEPDLMFFENPLYSVLPTASSYYDEKQYVIYGPDIDAAVGPLDKGFLPSPSIGYSSVYITNINTGPSNGGYVCKEYYTAKEYPSVVLERPYSDVTVSMPDAFSGQLLSFLEMWNTNTQNIAQVQYKLRFYNRHGLSKSETHFAGNLSLPSTAPHIGDVVSRTEYSYYDENDSKPVMYSGDSPIRYEDLGQTIEFWSEAVSLFQQHYFEYAEASVAVNTNPFPPFSFSLNPLSVSDDRTELLSITAEIVSIHNTPFLKEVRTVSNNQLSQVSFLAFNPQTGGPVLVKTIGNHHGVTGINTSGNFDGSVYSYSFPASDQISSFKSKTLNEGIIIIEQSIGVDAQVGEVSMDVSPNTLNINLLLGKNDFSRKENLSNLLHKGDIVEIFKSNSSSGALYKIIDDMATVPTSSGDDNVNYNIEPLSTLNTVTGDVSKVIVKKSGYENKTEYKDQSIIFYDIDDEIRSVFEYAQKLKVRDEAALLLNNKIILNQHIYNENDPSSPINNDFYQESLDIEQRFTFYNATIAGGQYDVIAKNNIVYNSGISNYKFKAQKNSSSSNIVELGFLNGYNWYVHPSYIFPPTGYQLKETKTFMTCQQFSINDDGYLVLARKKYLRDNPPLYGDRRFSIILPRCGKRISSTNDCYLTESPEIVGQRKNALPINVYSKTLKSEKIVYSDQYQLVSERLCLQGANPIRTVIKEVKPYKVYGLRSTVLTGNTNYNYGLHTYIPFSESNSDWQLQSVIESYNEFGIPVSVQDNLEQYMTTRYGLNGALALCSGTSARAYRGDAFNLNDVYFHDIYFQSFEDYSPLIRTGGSVINTVSHTGRKCLSISPNGNSTIQHNITPSDYNPGNRAYEISFWASSNNIAYSTNLNFSIGSISCSGIAPVAKTVTIDNNGRLWFLYRLQGTNVNNLFTSALTLQIQNSESNNLYIDDLKIRPIESSTVCYVYNPRTYQVDAILDDEHFASVTQYDMRGIPVRSLRETVGGWKTVAEQTMNIVRTNRPYLYPSASNPIIPQMRDNGSAIKNTQYSLPDNSQMNAKQFNSGQVDLFQLQLSPDSKHMRVLGVDADSSQSTKKKQQSRSEPK